MGLNGVENFDNIKNQKYFWDCAGRGGGINCVHMLRILVLTFSFSIVFYPRNVEIDLSQYVY